MFGKSLFDLWLWPLLGLLALFLSLFGMGCGIGQAETQWGLVGSGEAENPTIVRTVSFGFSDTTYARADHVQVNVDTARSSSHMIDTRKLAKEEGPPDTE